MSRSRTALPQLIISRDWDAVIARLGTGAGRFEARGSRYGNLPIHDACEYTAPLRVIGALIDAYPEGLHQTNADDGGLPLHIACYNKTKSSAKVIRLLITKYPEGVRKVDIDEDLPIHLACYFGASLEVIQMLRDLYPESLRIADEHGQIPIDIARQNRFSPEIIAAVTPTAVNPNVLPSNVNGIDCTFTSAKSSSSRKNKKDEIELTTAEGGDPKVQVYKKNDLAAAVEALRLAKAGERKAKETVLKLEAIIAKSKECAICFDKNESGRRVALQPCGHQSFCETCGLRADIVKCPICRATIVSRHCVRLP